MTTAEGGRLVLDTTAYSHLRVGHPGVLDAIARADTVVFSVVVLAELEAGFRMGSRARENRSSLEEFLAEPFVEVRDVTRVDARNYARVFQRLREGGTPIPLNDVWISATTLSCDGILLTFDEHFEVVTGLRARILSS